MGLKEETFVPKCTKENMVRYDVQVGSGKKEGSLKQKKKKKGLLVGNNSSFSLEV